MHKNPIWLGLLSAVLLAAVWFVGKASWQYYRYTSLSEKTRPRQVVLSVKEKSKNYFYPKARYSFEVKGKKYQGVQGLPNLKYFRKKFLEKDLPKITEEEDWFVWYSPKNPGWSSLERAFPYKDIFYAFIMIGLVCYFFWLGKFAGKVRT